VDLAKESSLLASIRINRVKEVKGTGTVRSLRPLRANFMMGKARRVSRCRIRTRIICIKMLIPVAKVELIILISHPLVVKPSM
jgi:hypothetical protein